MSQFCTAKYHVKNGMISATNARNGLPRIMSRIGQI
jgi:hypothetical protein